MVDVQFDLGTQGPLSVALAKGLTQGSPQEKAMRSFEQQSLQAPSVSVNAWTGVFDQIEKGRIIGNVVI